MRNPFRKDIEPRCAYCAHGSAVNECEVACSRRGVVRAADGSLRCTRRGAVQPFDHCRAFSYDPLRRVPPRPASLDPKAHSPEDFSL